MFVAERIISVLAPHLCIVCGSEGSIVCAWCMPEVADALPSRCYICFAVTDESATCIKCKRKSKLSHVWIRAKYEGYAKQLIRDFKFGRKQAAAKNIAQLMHEPLPFVNPDTIISHVPTATSRVRQRGYDQSEHLAKELAQLLNKETHTILRRVTQTRQVGAKRSVRIEQMEHAFSINKQKIVQGATVLLVDDLVTTGATLESAALCLKRAGAKKVNAVVFAQK